MVGESTARAEAVPPNLLRVRRMGLSEAVAVAALCLTVAPSPLDAQMFDRQLTKRVERMSGNESREAFTSFVNRHVTSVPVVTVETCRGTCGAGVQERQDDSSKESDEGMERESFGNPFSGPFDNSPGF